MNVGPRKCGGAGFLVIMLLAMVGQGWAVYGAAAPEITPDNLTDAEVLSAINRGIDYLIKDVDGKLESINKLPGATRADLESLPDAGELMLETYALLNVGGDVRDTRLQIHDGRMAALIAIAENGEGNSTYTTALQTLALAQLPQTKEVKAAISRTANELIKGRNKSGGYSYKLNEPQSETHDQSNSQYGLLGTWAAADWGIIVPDGYWKGTDEFWRKIQSPGGGWAYSMTGEPTPAMTAAGLASLLVCEEYLNRSTGLHTRGDVDIDRGMAALIKDFSLTTGNLYYFYGVERVGLASGRKFFGKNDWYRQIAAFLIRTQNDEGAFSGNFMGANGPRATAYAVLLLDHGRSPIVMNKLQYDGPWNARRRDSANMHAYLSKQYEHHYNWQIVPLSASADEWLDAPILLITGSKDPNFTEEDIAKLRQYVDAGGMIYSVADGESKEFSDAVAKYAAQMVPPDHSTGEGVFRELPADHPLFSIRGSTANPPKTFGISNGIRELWVHSPEDYGAAWQSYDKRQTDAWDMAANLMLYMSGKEPLRNRLQTLAVPAGGKHLGRHTTIARLQYAGNWDPEPGAWPRLAKIMAGQANTELTIKDVSIAALPGMAETPVLAVLEGTSKAAFTPEEQKALAAYVAAGGTLYVEAVGGSKDFAGAAGDLFKAVFPEGKLKNIPPDYLLYTGSFSPDTTAIGEVAYRRYWTDRNGRVTVPRLEYMTLNRRMGVIFSPDDLTSGLLGTNTWGVAGYSADSAIAIARNLVLYAWRNAPKPKAASH